MFVVGKMRWWTQIQIALCGMLTVVRMDKDCGNQWVGGTAINKWEQLAEQKNHSGLNSEKIHWPRNDDS